MTSFEDRARTEAERRFRGPRMFVGTTVDREIAAGVAMAVWAREQEPTECRCEPCPGRGNDGHAMTHCAECCFSSGVIAETDCPIHGEREPTEAQVEAAARAFADFPGIREGEAVWDAHRRRIRAALLAAKEATDA